MTHTDLLRQAADTIEAMWDRHSGGKLNIDAASSSFIHRAQLTLAALRAALAQPAPAVPDMQPLPNHDNHHNALLCPYCNPRKLKFAEPDAAPAVPIYGKYTADDLVRGVVESAASAVPAVDCRTCARCYATKGRGVYGCDSVVACSNGDRYQPLPPVKLWRAA